MRHLPVNSLCVFCGHSVIGDSMWEIVKSHGILVIIRPTMSLVGEPARVPSPGQSWRCPYPDHTSKSTRSCITYQYIMKLDHLLYAKGTYHLGRDVRQLIRVFYPFIPITQLVRSLQRELYLIKVRPSFIRFASCRLYQAVSRTMGQNFSKI